MRHVSSTIVLAAGLATAATGAGRTTTANVRPVPAPVKPAVRPAANRTLIVTAHAFAYTGLPVYAPAGWLTLRLVNTGADAARARPGLPAVGTEVSR